jgi:hypothetical protein
MCNFDTGSGTVAYETIRTAMGGEPFTMSLTDQDEIQAVIAAVNEGSTPTSKPAFAQIVATDTRVESGRPGNSSFVGPSNVPSARNRFPFCSVVCASRTWVAMRKSRLREIGLLPTS